MISTHIANHFCLYEITILKI